MLSYWMKNNKSENVLVFGRMSENLHTIYFLTKPALKLNDNGEKFEFATKNSQTTCFFVVEHLFVKTKPCLSKDINVWESFLTRGEG